VHAAFSHTLLRNGRAAASVDPGTHSKGVALYVKRILTLVAIAALGLAGLIALGNATIALAVPVARYALEEPQPEPVSGITHLRAVDDRVWRGDEPSVDSYRELARHGVTTIVDLRAEREIQPPLDVISKAGLHRMHLPIRDGQTPTADQVARFLAAVRNSPGRVYVHCGAGVGRTGTMAAAYLVQMASAQPRTALLRNVAVGPPSVEQLWYVGALESGTAAQPPAAVATASRVLDGPRRIWSRLR
jgi:protein tyrosine phosphatase (PTP) superfamily phosphohydrolase (DUF442 family)